MLFYCGALWAFHINISFECYISIVQKLTSDNEFLARIFDCLETGKMFSIQQLDLNLSQQDLQKF